MKTHINYEKMDTINHLKDAISILNKANWVFLNIPSDFSLAGDLSSHLSDLKNTTRDFSKLLDWLRYSKADYQRTEAELNYSLARVGSVEAKPYVSKIR